MNIHCYIWVHGDCLSDRIRLCNGESKSGEQCAGSGELDVDGVNGWLGDRWLLVELLFCCPLLDWLLHWLPFDDGRASWGAERCICGAVCEWWCCCCCVKCGGELGSFFILINGDDVDGDVELCGSALERNAKNKKTKLDLMFLSYNTIISLPSVVPVTKIKLMIIVKWIIIWFFGEEKKN